MSHALTQSIDTAQVVLYFFWIFFAGLIVWLRREDRREGYPLESEVLRVVGPETDIRIPRPKEYVRPHGESIRRAPDFVRDVREINAERVSRAPGFPLEPIGEPLLSGVGPASFAERSDHAELSHEDGQPLIVPMRAAGEYTVSAGPDPRGWQVLGADRKVAGVISDIWVDKADLFVRYLEVTLPGTARDGGGEGGDDAPVASEASPEVRLIPIAMLALDEQRKVVRVRALLAEQFALVPTTKHAASVSLREEDRISAFYAGGWFYAEPRRRESVL